MYTSAYRLEYVYIVSLHVRVCVWLSFAPVRTTKCHLFIYDTLWTPITKSMQSKPPNHLSFCWRMNVTLRICEDHPPPQFFGLQSWAGFRVKFLQKSFTLTTWWILIVGLKFSFWWNPLFIFQCAWGSWKKLNPHGWLNDSQKPQDMDHESSQEKNIELVFSTTILCDVEPSFVHHECIKNWILNPFELRCN